MDKSSTSEAIAGILILLVAAIFFAATGAIYEDPNDPGFSAQDFPRAIVLLIGLFSIVLLVRSAPAVYRSDWLKTVRAEIPPLLKYVIPIAVLGFLYVWMLELAQYLIPTILVTSAALALYGNRGVIRLVVVPVAGGVLYYTLFYGVLGLFEAPGSLIAYENTAYFQPLREFIGTP